MGLNLKRPHPNVKRADKAEKALEEATMHPERFDWVMNEGNPPTEPYLGDCAENDATEIEE